MRALGVLAVLAALIAVVASSLSSGGSDGDDGVTTMADGGEEAQGSEAPTLAASDIEVLAAPMTLTDLDGWLQAGTVDELEDLRGQVVVLQFWTFGCFNCKNTIPNLQALYAAHGNRDDFEIVGVHTPEFAYEKDPDAIQQAAIELGVTWPIALDTDKRNFRAWQGDRRFWPRTYVLDRDGNVRFDRIGEGAYDRLNATVAALLDADTAGA